MRPWELSLSSSKRYLYSNRLLKSMSATMSLPRLVVVQILLLLSFASSANSQVGVTLCACSPATYTFQLNFAFTCNDTSISGAGLNRTECFVSPFGFDPENITDFVPVAINAVDILELDQQLTPYTLTPIREDFRDLNEFKYTSITATDPNLTSAMIPGGLQMNIIGVNSVDEPIQNVWIIVFNNDCGIFPIYTVGEQIGWTLMTNLTLPNAQYCPAYTASPSSSPTGLSPTLAPKFPSNSPTSSPTVAPATAAPATAAPATAAPATAAPASTAPVTAQPTVSEPLASKAPATMAPTERVCPPISGKGSSESTGKGYYSPSSSASAKGSTESGKSGRQSSAYGKGSASKSGKSGSVKSGSSKSSFSQKKSGTSGSLRHKEKKSKSESKKHGEKLQKPSPPPPPSKPSPVVNHEYSGFRRLSKGLSSPAPSSSSSSLSKGKGYGYNNSYEPVSNIYQMSSGKGVETGSSGMDYGKGVDSSKGQSESSGKGYVMYDPHCYPPKKSRSFSASQMSKTSYDGKGSYTSGKGISSMSAKGNSADEGKGSSASSKGSGSKPSYKSKKHSTSSAMSMSKLYSNKSGKAGKAGTLSSSTGSLKGTSADDKYNDKKPSPSNEPITKPSPISPSAKAKGSDSSISPPPLKGKGGDTEHEPSMSSASSVKQKKQKQSEKHGMFSKKSLKYHDKKSTKSVHHPDDEDEMDEASLMPAIVTAATQVSYIENATATPIDPKDDHVDIDQQDGGDDIEQQQDGGDEPKVTDGGDGGGIDIFGFQEGEEEQVVSYQQVEKEEEEEEEEEEKDKTKNKRRELAKYMILSP